MAPLPNRKWGHFCEALLSLDNTEWVVMGKVADPGTGFE